jgi:hypothetical protein
MIERARAALAQPAPEPPTDEELTELSYEWFSRQNPWYYQDGCVAFARAALARWGAGVTGTVSFGTEDGTVVLKASQIEFIPPE